MTHRLQPAFPADQLLCVLRLSRRRNARWRGSASGDAGSVPVAERFEVYLGPLELANGYHELTDAASSARASSAICSGASERGDALPPIDESLLRLAARAFRPVRGVALGVDRLLMAHAGHGPHSRTCWPSISAGRDLAGSIARFASLLQVSVRLESGHERHFDFDRYDRIRPIRWTGDALELLDQRKLPFAVEYVRCATSDEVAAAIHALAVRGAPAIGIAAAWGVVLAAREVEAADGAEAAAQAGAGDAAPQRRAPDRGQPGLGAGAHARACWRAPVADWREALEREAQAIDDEDLAANRRMGALGAALIAPGSGVLTHCNTGSLATAGFGTALGVIRAGVAQGRIGRVFAGETRPWLQGARLTVWELQQDGIDADADRRRGRLAPDEDRRGAVGGGRRRPHLRQRRHRQQDRHLPARHRRPPPRREVHGGGAVLDRRHGHAERRRHPHRGARPGRDCSPSAAARTVAEGIGAWNPVFDVTPHDLIDAIVTERGVIERPDAAAMQAAFGA